MDNLQMRKIQFPDYVLANQLLPTNIAAALAHKHGLNKRTLAQSNDGFLYAIRDFQRLALTQDFETSCMMFDILLQEGKTLTDEDTEVMMKIYEVTKKEANGLIVGAVTELLHSANNRDKMDAAKLLSILVNDEQSLDGGDIRKLMAKVFK